MDKTVLEEIHSRVNIWAGSYSVEEIYNNILKNSF